MAEGTIDFLRRLIGGRKKQKPVQTEEAHWSIPVKEMEPITEDTALYKEITEYGKAHPELQAKYPNFDDLARHYMSQKKVAKMEAEKKPITTEEFLDGLKK